MAKKDFWADYNKEQKEIMLREAEKMKGTKKQPIKVGNRTPKKTSTTGKK